MKRLERSLAVAANEVQEILENLGARFCLIGGVAVARWGEPRATRDVDVSLFASWGTEKQVIDHLLSHFQPRFADTAEFAIDSRVLMVQTPNGTPLDISLAALPFEERVFDRASDWKPYKEVRLTTISADDLVVMKAFAGRDHDWLDIKGILIRQGDVLNWDCIVQELTEVAEYKPNIDMTGRLEQLRCEMKQRGSR